MQFEKKRDNKNTEYKIFVGNVPYQCTQEEFEKCFETVDGYLHAELIMTPQNISRGFGFITVKTYYNAEKLKLRDDIIFKGRVLRFTQYNEDDINYRKNMSSNYLESNNNYVYVDGIPIDKDKNWLKSYFATYEPIGKCFIPIDYGTKTNKKYGIIEIIDDIKYKNILGKKWHNIDGIQLYTTRYKTRILEISEIINDSTIYQEHIQNTGNVDVFNYHQKN